MDEIIPVAGTPRGAHAREPAPPAAEAVRRPKFGDDPGFQPELRRRVDAFFQATGRRERDCPQMYVKTALIVASFTAAY